MLRNSLSTGCLLLSACSLVAATPAWGLAALAAGSKTSCKITATDPVQRQIQINMDPLSVTNYSMVMEFNGEKLELVSVGGLNGYTVTTVDLLPTLSQIRVTGTTTNPLPGENDVFFAVFQLYASASIDDLLEFRVYALDNTDFVNSIDLATGQTFSSVGPHHPVNNPTGVLPSFDIGTVRDGSLIPEPTMLGWLPVVLLAGRRRRTA
jgi:hypothetical protein